MDSIENDPRFSHIVTDPRFRPMPKSKRKVKIDKRFNALFTSKHFKTKTDIDKRGRPVHDVSKRNKNVMKRFYELSDKEDSESEGENELSTVEKVKVTEDDNSDVKTKTQNLKRKGENNKKPFGQKSAKKKKLSGSETISPSNLSKKLHTAEECGTDSDDDDDFRIKGSDDDSDDEAEDESDSSSDDSDSDSDDDIPQYSEDHALADTSIEHKWNELHNDAVDISESTSRLAVCNMDWDFVKAQDLFVLLKSFVPEGGRVKSVIIYPSEYGKERMAEEAVLGPKEMRDMVGEGGEKSGVSENQTEGKKRKKGKKKNVPMDQKQQKAQDNDVKRFETEKLREYQLNRLRYYYAVVDCDSVSTADAIYSECDGKEYQLSSVRLDLRYIPDDMTFEDSPKDSFSEEQGLVDYAPKTFHSTALSQAQVDVTWDETDFDRLSKRVVGLQQKELESMVEENQYADMIAPPESDSEPENDNPDWLDEALAAEDSEDEEGSGGARQLTEDKKIQLYRKVLMDKLTKEEEAEENEVDQEIQFTPGLKSSAQEKLKKKKKEKASQGDIVEGYLEKKKLKKKKKSEEKKMKIENEAIDREEKDGDDAFSDDDLPSDIDDDLREMMESEGVSVKKSKGKKKKKVLEEDVNEDSEAERERAELELLLMGDGEKSLAKPKTVDEGKMSKKKKKKMAKLAKEKKDKEKQDFDLDLNDDRFNALFTSHHFHIDPNAPQFKKTKNMVHLIDEQISRKKKPKPKKLAVKETSEDKSAAPDSKSISKQLVESLKRKMKK